MKIFVFALISTIIGDTTLVLAKQPCNNSFWVWQGGERVKVCCNQQNFCFTKYGVYTR